MLVLKTMTHQMSEAQIINLWSEGTDAEIVNILKDHYDGKIDLREYWSIGDERVVHLSAMNDIGVSESHVAQDVVLVLSNVGGKYLEDNETECLFQVDQKGVLCNGNTVETGYMNATNTNEGGWKNSARRTWCNEVYYNAIPSSLRSIFKKYINQSGLGNGSISGVENTVDYFALRAEIEVLDRSLSVTGEGSQVKYYETSSNRIKSGGNTTISWYERSPLANDSERFGIINSSGTALGNRASVKAGIAPFGVI